MATRKCSEMTLNALTNQNHNLIGGSADLAGSNNTKTKYQKIIKPGDFSGDYIHYGVREHGMSGIMNGIALYGNLIPYGGTFLIFSDYCKPSIRLSALMQKRVIYVMTHDSIGLHYLKFLHHWLEYEYEFLQQALLCHQKNGQSHFFHLLSHHENQQQST